MAGTAPVTPLANTQPEEVSCLKENKDAVWIEAVTATLTRNKEQISGFNGNIELLVALLQNLLKINHHNIRFIRTRLLPYEAWICFTWTWTYGLTGKISR